MTTPTRDARRPRWVLAFLAAAVAVVLSLPGAAPASAATATTAQNAVGASTSAGQVAVGLSASITAGQRLGNDTPLPGIVVATGVATNTADAASGTGRVFAGTSRGTIYDIPEGWVGRAANNNKGIVYQRAGAEGNADMVRIMEPTPKYPDGYVRVYNSGGQPVDVFGKPGPPADTHIPGTYSGPWPGWPK